MRHLSLFSGIGGFDLAAEWMGWENVAQVEKDIFCLKILEKNFPNTKRYEDIKQFNGADYAGRVDIVTGGFPCQPFSQAGTRRGTDDDRYLWPEMLRVIREIKPTWVIAENVYGLLTIQQGVVFEQVCADLEREGYEVQPIIIPACGLNAPHRRYRVWFIANAKGKRGGKEPNEECTFSPNQNVAHCKHERSIQCEHERQSRPKEGLFEGLNCNVADPERKGWGKRSESEERPSARFDDKDWLSLAAEICGVDDGLPIELDGFKRTKAKNRAERIKSLGNAIVPQVAYLLFESIK